MCIVQSSLIWAVGTFRERPACGDRVEDHCLRIKRQEAFSSLNEETEVNED